MKTQLPVIFQEAAEAAEAALKAVTPEPMNVVQRADPLDDDSPVVQRWHVPEGLCGFAWVTIYPGNCTAANYAKKHESARKAYYGGVEIRARGGGQSYERKMAWAQAYADVLRAAGIKAYAGGRLD